MCGIAGLFRLSTQAPPAADADRAVCSMIAALRHRGPDQQGFYRAKDVCLGHARLSIVDLANGRQPIANEDSTCHLVYNGEVYDYQTLRKDLEQRHTFSTHSDSEVLLHLYEESGAAFVEKLNGMYAFALHDVRRGELHLGIDPLGIKPLYWFRNERLLLFASELRGLLAGMRALGIPIEVADTSLAAYLECGFFPAPLTPLAGVYKFRPGEQCVVRATGIEFRRRSLNLSGEPLMSADPLEDLDRLLCQTVASQLVADVPVGIFLSGGIDSSLLAAIAARDGGRPKTFSVGFRGNSAEVAAADESPVAAAVAREVGTEHHELTLSASDLLLMLDDAFLAMDEPIADPAVLPLLAVARLASQHVKVCLSGDGGDEVFGGYLHHRLWPYRRAYQRFPLAVQRWISATAQVLPRRPSAGVLEKLRKARVACQLVSRGDYFCGPFSGTHHAWLSASQPVRQVDATCWNDVEWYFRDGLRTALAGQFLPKTDRITMFASLEARVPFLDNRIVEFGARVPWGHKVSRGQTKLLLRRLLARYLPESIVRRRKHGFKLPLSGWFRCELSGMVRECLLDDCAIPESAIPRHNVEGLVWQHTRCEAEHGIRIWSLLALNHWLKQVIDTPRVPRAKSLPVFELTAGGASIWKPEGV